MKMYSEDGNWDLVGNNTPIFFIRDPMMVCISPLELIKRKKKAMLHDLNGFGPIHEGPV